MNLICKIYGSRQRKVKNVLHIFLNTRNSAFQIGHFSSTYFFSSLILFSQIFQIYNTRFPGKLKEWIKASFQKRKELKFRQELDRRVLVTEKFAKMILNTACYSSNFIFYLQLFNNFIKNSISKKRKKSFLSAEWLLE